MAVADAPTTDERPPRRTSSSRRVPLALATWALIVVVLAIVVVLLLLEITRGAATVASGLAGPPVTPAPPGAVAAATSIPDSVYDKVGAPVTPPAPIAPAGQAANQPGGPALVVFVGGEFCPYCAAERWVVVTALARFGTFHHLGATSSAANQVFPHTPTFTFDGAGFSSRWVRLDAVEAYSDLPSSHAPAGVPRLRDPDATAAGAWRRYAAAVPGGAELPFLDVADRLVASGAAIGLSPGVLAAQSLEHVAAGLGDPTSTTTQAIVGAANEVVAAICAATAGRPAGVCQSAGTRAGAARLGIG
jgi:Domain of unknown function (DUF929)